MKGSADLVRCVRALAAHAEVQEYALKWRW
jgi:hypothetical protein